MKTSKIEIFAIYAGIIFSFITYEFFNKLTPISQPIVMEGWLDKKIPVITIFTIPYLSFHILAMFLVPYLSMRFGGRKTFLVNGLAIMIGQFILDIAYWLFQTEVPRPEIASNNFFDWLLTNVIYGNDRPLNGFPSNHVTWSAISIIALWRLRKVIPKTSRYLSAWFCLIIPATVFLKQHFVVDIYGGILVAFTAYWALVFLIEKPDLQLKM